MLKKLPVSIPVFASRFKSVDLLVFLIIGGIITLVANVASGWRQELQPALEISLEPANLLIYSLNSLVRIFAAYSLSFVFTIWFGYTASKSKLHERVMIPLLDVFQSIPVLSFLPGVMMAMIALFPGRRIGLELASILLIFTGQVWNMAFSYYNSVNTIPRELKEVSNIYRHGRFTRFLNLDLPFSAIGLVWNSMMSVAGGWFFLMACEIFVLKDRDFRLPGLGSYISTAAGAGDMFHVFYGLGTMIALIILLDIFLWRPVIAWSQKFRFDTVQAEDERESFVLKIVKRSAVLEYAASIIFSLTSRLERRRPANETTERKAMHLLRRAFSLLILAATVMLLAWSISRGVILLSTVDKSDYLRVLEGAFFSFFRTTAAIALAALWTVPLGVYIGLNPRAARVLQPIVQIAASVPATAVFPVILLVLVQAGGGLGMGSIFLMLLGTQWYILFNVIAGASAIPQDLKEAASLYRVKGLRRWKVLVLPGIFPYLITGFITATGGAWNSTIVSEYITFAGQTLETRGLGSLINESTVNGDFGLLLLSTLVMASIVVTINRLLWKRMFALSQEKYRLD